MPACHSLAIAIAVAAPLLWVGVAQADTIVTQWDFNAYETIPNRYLGTLTPNIGMGAATTVGTTGSFDSGISNNGSSDPADPNDDSGWQITDFATTGTENKQRGVQFRVGTVGYAGIVVKWDQRHATTSSSTVRFQYTLNADASNPVWTDGAQFAVPRTLDSGDFWYRPRTVDLSAVAGVSNNANFAFRIVSEFATSTLSSNLPTYTSSRTNISYNPTGTWRFDMVTVTGIPEPASLTALLGLAILRRPRRD